VCSRSPMVIDDDLQKGEICHGCWVQPSGVGGIWGTQPVLTHRWEALETLSGQGGDGCLGRNEKKIKILVL